jgi:hypothetical protein
MSGDWLLVAEGLTKRFGRAVALAGANGAGLAGRSG